jgi:hypothetical protein
VTAKEDKIYRKNNNREYFQELKYSRTPLHRITWEGEAFGCAENLGNWIFLLK